MIADLKPYPAMKDSGVEWLGNVPEHWEVRRLKYLLREQDSRSADGDEQLLRVSQYTGVTERKAKDGSDEPDTRAASLVGYKCVEANDLVVNIMLAWNGSMGVSASPGICSPAYCVYRFNGLAVPLYFHNLLRSPVYKARIKTVSTGIVESRLRLYSDDLYCLEGLLPPLPEQTAIVRYLDHVDRRVRRLVRAKRKLIALLTEQKQAIIHRAVTRGLDPDVPLKDSGVEWLGEVPEHWEVIPYKRRVALQEGPGIMAADFRDSGVPLLRISCLRGDSATLDGCNYLDPKQVAARWSHFAVNAGDYLLSASGSTGAITQATDVVEGSIPYTGIIRLWPAQSCVDMRFITLFMSSQLFQDQILVAKTGVGIEHFGPTHLKEMLLVLPPQGEQQAIVEWVSTEQAPIDIAISRAEREIELLNEYRTRLIADVVTGKLDVREAVAALPEVDPLAETDDADELDADLDMDAGELDEAPEEAEA